MDVWLRDGDWRMPVRAGGTLEVFDGLHLCGEYDARILLEMLSTHFRIANVVAVIQAGARNPLASERFALPALPPEPLPEHRKPLAPPLRGNFPAARRTALREKRRQRRRAE